MRPVDSPRSLRIDAILVSWASRHSVPDAEPAVIDAFQGRSIPTTPASHARFRVLGPCGQPWYVALGRHLLMSEPRAGRPPDAVRFEDRGEIARGGMGSVHAMWDHLLERRTALKELWNEGDTKAAARVRGGLHHPNSLPVHDLHVDEAGGPPRLLMKLVEGRTLSDLLHESTVPPTGLRLERLLGVVIKVCDAVSFAHSHGVIHRDLHPRNVMVGSHGQGYLMGWGLAIRRDAPPPQRASE